ncbi:MAG: amino acid adenylation domain-containing protein [Flavobacterium sp.]
MNLKKAIVEEFLNKFLTDNLNTNSISFFGGTNLKNENSMDKVRVYLNKQDVTKVNELCNRSDILVFDFYFSTLSILLSNYEENFSFLSAANQFDSLENERELFVLKPVIDKNQSFKSVFSSHKQDILKAIDHTFDLDIFKDSFLNFEDFQKKVHFGIVINNQSHEVASAAKTIFNFNLDSEVSYLEISIKGEMYDKQLLTLFGENFNKLLNGILQNTNKIVKEIEFRGDTELSFLNEVNKPKAYFSLDNNIVDLLNQQCQKQNDKTAIRSGLETITYLSLYGQTNKIARYILEEYGAKRDDLFGVMLSRSINMVKGILSVWKAASAYVPIATNLSDEALLHIIENSNLKAVITDDVKVIEQLNRLATKVSILNLNEIDSKISNFSDASLEIDIDLSDLAYVIYTSGSTGKPKGAMIEHFGMLNHIGAKITEIAIDSNSIVAQNAPHTFDISVWQFFAPLVAGGTSIIYDDELVLNVNQFVDNIAVDQVTVLELVPSYLLEILNYIENENKIKLVLNSVILNAETLTKAMVKRWLDLYPNIPIINTYGATEVSDDISHVFMSQVPGNYSVPVMKDSIQNCEVHIVDQNMQRVPIGVKGQILLAGPCVGRGYFNDKKRTKDAFLKGPMIGITSSERIYKTGDLGRFMPDGTMEFIGRNDNQVKILGHRIELDAIENIANEIRQVKNAKAIAYTDKQIIALYYLSENEIDKKIIEEQLLKKLPKYMIPAAYIHMQNFPLTKNGKIDKKLLPLISEQDLVKNDYVSSRNEIEEQLVEIWQEVLAIEKIGINDNFFELGGHSLLAFQVFNRINKKLGKSVPLKIFFENPTIQDLSSHLKEVTYTAIPLAEPASSYPVTTSQRRFWILNQLEGASLAYNMPTAVKLNGTIDVPIFEESFKILIERHEALRTYYDTNEEGEVRQYIIPTAELKFSIEEKDFSNEPDQEILIVDYFKNKNAIPFSLDQCPLLRASMVRLDKDSHVFFLSMHHIIGDGWSMKLMVSEIVQIYNSLVQGKEINLPDLKIQYKDYAVWVNAEIKTQELKTSEQYWLEQFSGDLPVLDLPGYKVRPLIQTYNGESVHDRFSKKMLDKIKSFSKSHDVTMFMTLVTAIKVLLYKYSNQTDIISGTSIAGREHPDLESQIGLFLNLLPIRTIIDKKESFTALLKKEKQILLQAYEHQSYPFDELVEKLNIKRDRSRSVLFDIMIDLQNQDQLANLENKETLKDLEVEGYGIESRISKFDIEFTFMEEIEGLLLNISYNTDIYDRNQMINIFSHLENIFTQVFDNPGILIQEIDCLSEIEKSRLLGFRADAFLTPIDKSFVQLFEDQVVLTPDNIAVVFDGGELTYKELDNISDQLSYTLRTEFDIAKGDKVGVQLSYSKWSIISILGILKSGAVYIPVDSELPDSRKAFIIEDTALKLLITETSFIFELDFYEGNILSIDVEFIASEDFKEDKIDVALHDLAYIIYTSGSTGLPKGVMVANSSLSNYLVWAKDYYLNKNLNNTNFGLFTSLSFDLTITSLFLPLISGGSLTIFDSANQISNVLEKYFASKISCIKLTPAHINVLGDLELRSNTIEIAIVGGEELRQEHVTILKKINPSIKIYNEYGPTEATVGCIVFEVTSTEEAILIGRPIRNTSIYILDESYNLQIDGAIGEIFIGGDALAKGYLNRPDLTAEKFLENKFNKGELIYKTGDLGKWLPDGTIDYKGRIDDQVKVRGYRIELREIETHIAKYSDTIQQVIVLIKEVNKEKTIVAYYLSDSEINKAELRNYLLSNIPEYMVPAFYIKLETIPLTSNGKIDKKALPNITGEDIIKKEYVAPRNETESAIAEIWQEVLGIDKIGITDNFFELGGHSIIGIKIVAEIQKIHNVKIDLVNLFREPTIKGLAEKIVNDIWYNNDVTEQEVTDKIII